MQAPNYLQAIVLTGARLDSLQLTGLAEPGQTKAMLPILGQPMVGYVLQALAKSRFQPKVTLCGSDPRVQRFARQAGFPCLPSEPTAVDTLLGALECLPGDGPVLIATGDHPLLTAEMVDAFIAEAVSGDLAFAVAAVRRSVVKRAYPQAKRTFFAVKGDAYSGGNLFWVDRRRFSANRPFMAAIDRHRKSPWRHALLCDPLSALRLLLRRYDLQQVSQLASQRLGCQVGIVDLPFAECCMDVDKPEDLILAEQILRERRQTEPFVTYSQYQDRTESAYA